MSTLKDRQIKAMAEKMASVFENKTGLKVNKELLVNSLLEINDFESRNRFTIPDAELDMRVEKNYKDLYKKVLTDTIATNSKRLVNPGNRKPFKKGESLNRFCNQIDRDHNSFIKKTSHAALEFESFMTTIHDVFYEKLTSVQVKAPSHGGLTSKECEDIARGGHVDVVKYNDELQKFKKTKASENIVSSLYQRMGDMNEVIGPDKDTALEELEKSSMKALPMFGKGTENEKIAAYVALPYMLLKRQHDKRNFFSQIWHYEENRALSDMRNYLREIIPGYKHATNDAIEKLLSSVEAKTVSIRFPAFDTMAITQTSEKAVNRASEKYQAVAEAELKNNEPVKITEVKEMDDKTATMFRDFARGKIPEAELNFAA